MYDFFFFLNSIASVFWGHSIFDSVTSITITLGSASLSHSFFFPGNLKLDDFIKTSSTFLIIRKAVDSYTPQSLAI